MLDISWNVPPEDIVLMEPTEEILIQLAPILRGPPGPTGTYEDELMYSKRIDFITDNLLYKAEAAVGSSESAPVWRIRYITISNDSDVMEVWASGTAEFDKQWTERATYIYSQVINDCLYTCC